MTHYIHQIDPVIFSAGPIQVRWYGMMYLVGFVVGYYLMVRRYKKGLFALSPEHSQNIITYIMLGMMLGARLIYVLVYNPSYYMENPGEILAIWHGGLSFHGAALGFVIAVWQYGKKYGFRFYQIMDTIVIGSASGIFFGRLGNFINGELYGRVADVPWAIVFAEGGPLPRHPSQLYQAFGEGLSVFVLLHVIQWWQQKRGDAPKALEPLEANSKKKKRKVEWKKTGVISTSFLILYGVARFIVEFFREPDAQLGYYFGWMTMGQILCTLMIVAGAYLLFRVIKNPHSVTYEVEG